MGLARSLGQAGGFCDCEVFLNAWILKRDLAVLEQGQGPPQSGPRPACQGVRQCSMQPCDNWTRLR